MKKSTIILFIVIMLLSLAVGAGCGKNGAEETSPALMDETRKTELHELSRRLTDYMRAGNEADAMAMMDSVMQKAMDGKVAEVWNSLLNPAGEFVETGGYTGFLADGYDVIEMTLIFEKASYIQRTAFTGDNLVTGLFFRAGAVETDTGATAAAESGAAETLPEGIAEENVAVDAGSGYPLDGLLTLPTGGASAALVLIHGSGPSDMDETVGPNKPFRDIAYALAQEGVAVLRYDKRTYTYGAKIAEDHDLLAKLTVYDETVYDAAAAVNLLKQRFDRVYILGHSLGGGLLSEINAQGADCAGYIIMAGSPRKPYALSADQNLLIADERETNGAAEEAEQIRALVQSEWAKAAKIADLSDADALSPDNAVFGMSAWYLRSFEGIDAAKLHLSDGKPVLVLQGGRDRQVTSTDFELWKTELSGHPDASFKFYPELNHLMGDYEGDEAPFSELVTVEYAQATPVSEEVTGDIADWILSRGNAKEPLGGTVNE
jgi:alpha-beta hydrolase superfamily lysophospholipase